MIVSVTAALAGLEVVRLTWLDGSEAGTSTHNVHDKGRKLGSSHIGQTFLHQADTRAGRRSHHPLSRAGSAIDHIDRRNLALSLENNHTGGLPRLLDGQSLKDF